MARTVNPHVLDVLPHQLRVLEAPEQHLGMPAGLGSGKSRGLALWGVVRSYENAIRGTVLAGLLVEPTYKQVQRILVRELMEVLSELGIPYRYHKVEQRFRLHFGDGLEFDVLLGSADRPETLVGPNLCFVGLDEAGFMRAEAFEKSIPRVRHPKAKRLQWLATGTPEGFGPYYEYLEGEKKLPDFRLVRARTLDNVFLRPSPEAYVATSLGHYSDDERQQYVEGRFVARGGRVYEHFSAEKHERECPDPFAGDLVMLCDFGVQTSAFLFGTVVAETREVRGQVPEVRETLWIWGEEIGRRTGTLTMADRVVERWVQEAKRRTGQHVAWQDFVGRIAAHCDSSPWQRADREILLDRGFDVRASSRNEAVMDRVYSVNAKLRRDELLVDPKGAPLTAQALRQQGYDRRGYPEKADDDGTGTPGLDHPADALGYGVVHRWPVLAPHGNREAHAYH